MVVYSVYIVVVHCILPVEALPLLPKRDEHHSSAYAATLEENTGRFTSGSLTFISVPRPYRFVQDKPSGSQILIQILCINTAI